MIIVQHLSGGGAERMAAELSNVLAEEHNVVIVIFSESVEYKYSGQLEICDFGDYAAGNKLHKLLIHLKRWRKIRKLKKSYHIEVSISYLPDADLVNYLSKRKELVIGAIRTNPLFECKKGTLYYRIRQYVLRHMDAIVTPSDGVRNAGIEYYCLKKNKIHTIYNVCNVQSIRDKACEKTYSHFGIKKDDICFVTMGSLRYPKGQWHLIKAFKIINERYNNTKLLIIGDGPYKKQLESLVEQLGLDGSVVLTGHLENPHELVSGAYMFLFSSIYESFANVLVEAMALGVPCVSTACDFGPSEILGEKSSTKFDSVKYLPYGVLVPAFTVEPADFSARICDEEKRYANVVCNIIDDEKLRINYSKAGPERVLDFGIEKYKENWNSLIRSLM